VSDARPAGPHVHHLRVQRTARYYTLGGGTGAPRAIWFVLHGYGQLAAEFIRYFGDLATDDTLVVAPEAMNRFYLTTAAKVPVRDRPVGATWMTREDRESEIADYVEYLDGLFDEIAAHPVHVGARVYVLGFSQGAATASRWAAHGHAHLDGLIIWGGQIPPDSDLSRGPASLRHAALTFVVGSRDQYIDATMIAAEQARLDAAGIPYRLIQYDGGHAISRGVFPRLLAETVSGVSGR
jgi:predicted esterase